MKVPPHRSVKHYKLMKDNKSSSSVIDNFLSTEEIQYFYKWWQDHRQREKAKGDISQIQIGNKGQVPKGTSLGNLRYSYAYEELKEILQPKIQKALGTDSFRALPGKFYYVPKDYVWDTVHTDVSLYESQRAKDLKEVWEDLGYPEEIERASREGCPSPNGREFRDWATKNPQYVIPSWKTIIVPLWCPGEATTVTFDQYNYDGEKLTGWYNWDENNIEYKTNKMSITEEQFNGCLQHIRYDKEKLYGLSIENVFHWKVGSAFMFDSAQLHMSGYCNDGKVGFTIWVAHNE
jgi:hypothetical protein